MNKFWVGFEKKALQDTKAKETAATALSSYFPFGTTAHTALREGRDGK